MKIKCKETEVMKEKVRNEEIAKSNCPCDPDIVCVCKNYSIPRRVF